MTSGGAQQRLQRAGADDVAPQRLVDRQHRRVADRATRTRAAPRRPGAASAAPGSRARRSRTSSTSSPRCCITPRGEAGARRGGAERPSPPGRAGRGASAPGPSPRSIDSASPRWSGIRCTHRRRRSARVERRRRRSPIRGRRGRSAPGSANRPHTRTAAASTGHRGHHGDQHVVAAGHDLVGQRVAARAAGRPPRCRGRGGPPTGPRARRTPGVCRGWGPAYQVEGGDAVASRQRVAQGAAR